MNIASLNKILLPEVKYPNILKYSFIVEKNIICCWKLMIQHWLPIQLWINHVSYAVWVIQSEKWEWNQQIESLKILMNSSEIHKQIMLKAKQCILRGILRKFHKEFQTEAKYSDYHKNFYSESSQKKDLHPIGFIIIV